MPKSAAVQSRGGTSGTQTEFYRVLQALSVGVSVAKKLPVVSWEMENRGLNPRLWVTGAENTVVGNTSALAKLTVHDTRSH
jgi:hypothetical protein